MVPSLNVTVPVAAEGVTVAVKVTDEPYVEGFADEDTAVDVFVFANALEKNNEQMRASTMTRILDTLTPPMICQGELDDS